MTSGQGGVSFDLKGTVNPEGLPVTSCWFEYGTSSSYGSPQIPCSPLPGSGGTTEPVAAHVTRLVPDVVYHYRLIAADANGTNKGPDETFRPLRARRWIRPARVSVECRPVLHDVERGDRSENVPTNYHFVYERRAHTGRWYRVTDLYTPVKYTDGPVTQELTGLQAGTTYHFALQATNVAGTTTGPDETFTTASVPSPAVSTVWLFGYTRYKCWCTGSVDPMGWDTTYRLNTAPPPGMARSGPRWMLTSVRSLAASR